MKKPLHLFDAYGVELEYMIVDRDSLAIKPITDELLKSQLGNYGSDFENGLVSWSNELVLHVVELKSTKPEANLNSLEHAFADNVREINKILSQWNAMLLPTAAHPFMNPAKETKLWPHDNNEVYAIYNMLFDCKGHGWSNLQSTHLNLPFQGDEEFGKLHAAIRLILPLLPALCASSPILDGKFSGYDDTRLTFYKTNQAKIPSITGKVIPEPLFTEKTYDQHIYKKIESDIAPFNKDGILEPLWVNSRGAIPRFDRGSIEIRVMDIQECPAADIAVVVLVTETLKAFVNEKFSLIDDQKEALTDVLAGIFEDTIRTGAATPIYSTEYSSLLGINSFTTPKEIWMHLFRTLLENNNSTLQRWEPEISILLNEGSLASRITKSVGKTFNEQNVRKTYRQLSDCLAQNKMFIP